MIFICNAMLYYGVILFTMRKITKVEDAVMIPNKPYYDKNIGRTNSIIKWDRFMLFFHLIAFILFNCCYFGILYNN